MKQLHELINCDDPGWPVVQQWIADAKNHVEVLPRPDDKTREEALVATQVTTRSPMGAIIYETGGILVDHGWIRILGSGHPRLPRTLPGWNFGRSFSKSGQQPAFLLCADDAAGGFFAIDGGGLQHEPGKVCYFAPDTLVWENLNIGYSQFVAWCFQGDIAKFFESLRWPGWEKESATLPGDQVFDIFPPPCFSGKPIAERDRGPISIAEFYALNVGNAGERKPDSTPSAP
ncbi:MAG: hypothetical protein RLY20_345 [Verrucomicrobiota bacterium]|jgi:hypothetical protein